MRARAAHRPARPRPLLQRTGAARARARDDNGPVAGAVAVAQPGDVLVVDGASRDAVALVGGIVGRRALARGVVAIVVDGCIRDLDELVELGLPVYALGTTPLPPSKLDVRDPVDAVICGDREIRRGDVVTGDRDGVVVVPAARWDEVRAAARLHSSSARPRSCAGSRQARSAQGRRSQPARRKPTTSTAQTARMSPPA